MIDCPNVEMRDQLPDFVSDSLDPVARGLVLAHVEQCAACTAEVEILRTTRLILVTTTPKVNVASIAMALPTYQEVVQLDRGLVTAPSSAGTVSPTRRWTTPWRAAAVTAFLAAGLGSYSMISRGSAGPLDSPLVAVESGGLALTGALAHLTEDELTALASDIATIEALPSAEVQTIGSPVVVPTILPDSIVRDLEEVR